MSSFRRRTAVQPIAGTRPSPYNTATLLSTGLSSIDDLLGGGLPLSTSLLIEADSPTSYADLLLRYWVAQGFECNQDMLVVASGLEGGPAGFVDALMDVDGGKGAQATPVTKEEAADDEEERQQEEALNEKMKIAFRYEGMKQHQTTVDGSRTTAIDNGTYCSIFDLTSTRQLTAADRQLLHLIDVDELDGASSSTGASYDLLFDSIERLVEQGGFKSSTDNSTPRKALRIALVGFGSPSWGPAHPTSLFSFLHRLRHLLRQSDASCLLTFPAYLYATVAPTVSLPSSSTSSSPLLSRLPHAVDGVLRLTSFASSPLLSQTFPRHAGLLSTPKLPLLPPGTLVPPGSKVSVLRGLGGGSDARDNLVGFRVKRRRFVVEIVTDDPVGGDKEDEEKREGERRRKRVEEANRKEREMAGGRSGAEILLGVGDRVAQVRIGGPEEEDESRAGAATASASAAAHSAETPPLPSVGRPSREPARPAKKVSVARMVHERPDLLDF